MKHQECKIKCSYKKKAKNERTLRGGDFGGSSVIGRVERSYAAMAVARRFFISYRVIWVRT